jgi:soluble lytic murein transglycosylase
MRSTAAAAEKTEDSKTAPEKMEAASSASADTPTDAEEAENEDDEKTLQTMEDAEEEDAEPKEEEAEAPPEMPVSPFQNAKMAKRFKRANELIAIGLNKWATWELYEIERRTAQPQHLKTLISSYESIEAFHRSSLISYTYFGKQRFQGGFNDARFFWQSAYPRAFERSVTNFSRAFGVGEEFVWAIMRAESRFKVDIKSPMGALGLMQLMPYTAGQVAKLMGFNEFTVPQLFEAATNIRIGTRYLQRLLKQFNQTVPLAAAAYNAGPHRVRGWLKTFGGKLEMDEFIEHIPYLETRNYVKKVVHNYFIYRQLYGKSPKGGELLAWLAKPVGVTVTGDVETRESWGAL